MARQDWRVAWEVDVEAEDPVEAAQIARAMQLRDESSATVFTVSPTNTRGRTHDVDLFEGTLDGEEFDV